ncbi:citrate transporter [Candidatus Magnetoovum chiemensis]|nr:citrate transporter [Candidatus Magnetoovum chiemensis]
MHETSAQAQPFVYNSAFWLATIIFALAYIMIITEKVHKTVVAIVGAGLVLILKILEQREAFHLEEFGIDWNVIFLLISMMVIINLIRPTGFFEYIAIKSAKIGKAEPLRIMIIFAVITAVLSALLDNVTTVLLLAPVTLLIADALKLDPKPYLIMEVVASNIGGTATLIGDPPNIMIASKARLDFMDFIIHLTPIVIVMMAVLILIIKVVFGKRGVSMSTGIKQKDIINVQQYITDKEGNKTAAIINIDELDRLRKILELIPYNERWLYENKEAVESVIAGLKDAAEGNLTKINLDEL